MKIETKQIHVDKDVYEELKVIATKKRILLGVATSDAFKMWIDLNKEDVA